MTTSLFAANVIFAPLQQLARRLARLIAPPPTRVEAPAHRPASSREVVTCAPANAPRRLRVVRVFEGAAPASAGRMVISGRMADVCAELERLAALEAAAGQALSLRA